MFKELSQMTTKTLIDEEFDLLTIFFPVMKLKSVYQLQNGKIGPISTLIPEYPILNDLSPFLSQNYVNDEAINDPIIAVSDLSPDKLLDEIEIITFFAASSEQARGEEEILGQRHTIGLFKKDNKVFLNLDGYAVSAAIDLLQGTRFQYFPHAYFTWDDKAIDNFEAFISELLNSNFFKALNGCFQEVQDKEMMRDRARILISVKIFNEAIIPPNVPSIHMFSKSCIILLGAAFEALLNLPQENIEKAFQHSVMLLAGNRSTILKRWCKEFYNYRSRLAHGDIDWYGEEQIFNIGGNKSLSYPCIASRLFVHCLQTKLFLMGLFPEYRRDEFLLKAYV